MVQEKESVKAARRFTNAPDPQAYYSGLSPGRKRLVNAGLSEMGLVRVEPLRRPPPAPTPQAPVQTTRRGRGRPPVQAPTPPTPTQTPQTTRRGRGRPPAQAPTPPPQTTRRGRGRTRAPPIPPLTPAPTPPTTRPSASVQAAQRYLAEPQANRQAYYNALSPGRKRLVNAGLSQLTMDRITPLGRTFFQNIRGRQISTGTRLNVSGRAGNVITLFGSQAQTYYYTITPTPPLRTITEVREAISRQNLSFFNPNKIYGVRVRVDYENGYTSGTALPSQMYLSALDLMLAIMNMVAPITGHLSGPISQLEFEIIEI
jgi:hypothetical protein